VNPSGRTSPAFERYTPGAPPEIVLGPKRIYTLNVNMPNVNSAAGSWILHFAEMNEESGKRTLPDGTPVLGLPLPITDLQGPVALRKVDPKYPPILASARVQGEVVLYAIIRRDGSVDSIQLVKGVDPTLNQNAIQALAQWRFKPAERRGEAVELEALVYIPFRSVAP
jgi:protein TonB